MTDVPSKSLWRRPIVYVLLIGLLLLVAAAVMAVVAVWTVGPDSRRWGETALICGFIGFIITLASATYPGPGGLLDD